MKLSLGPGHAKPKIRVCVEAVRLLIAASPEGAGEAANCKGASDRLPFPGNPNAHKEWGLAFPFYVSPVS